MNSKTRERERQRVKHKNTMCNWVPTWMFISRRAKFGEVIYKPEKRVGLSDSKKFGI